MKIKETMLSNRIPETSTNLDQKIQKPSSSLTKRNPHQINPIELISITIGGRGDNRSHDLEERSITSELPIPLRSVPLSIFQPDRESPLEEREPWTERWWRDDAATSLDLDLRPRLTERQSPSSHDGREGCQRQSDYVNIPSQAVINARFKLLERVLIRFEVLSGRIKASVTNKRCSSGWM